MATKTKKLNKTQLMEFWQEAQPIKGKNPDMWRKDENGTIMRFADYEGTGKYAWQIK
jgi:hypothetical protein